MGMPGGPQPRKSKSADPLSPAGLHQLLATQEGGFVVIIDEKMLVDLFEKTAVEGFSTEALTAFGGWARPSRDRVAAIAKAAAEGNERFSSNHIENFIAGLSVECGVDITMLVRALRAAKE